VSHFQTEAGARLASSRKQQARDERGEQGERGGPEEAAPEASRQYLREHQSPALIAWGPHDGYMPEAARAYLRDPPDAALRRLNRGHWALETNLDEIVGLTRDFLGRVFG
jgi:pimeloyl-ACP methyl ester carboxylesterase